MAYKSPCVSHNTVLHWHSSDNPGSGAHSFQHLFLLITVSLLVLLPCTKEHLVPFTTQQLRKCPLELRIELATGWRANLRL